MTASSRSRGGLPNTALILAPLTLALLMLAGAALALMVAESGSQTWLARIYAGFVAVAVFAVAFVTLAVGWSPSLVFAMMASRSLLPDAFISKVEVLQPWAGGKPRPPAAGMQDLAVLFHDNLVASMGNLDSLLITQQVFAADMGQKVLDQYSIGPDEIQAGGDPRVYSRCGFWPLDEYTAATKAHPATNLRAAPWPLGGTATTHRGDLAQRIVQCMAATAPRPLNEDEWNGGKPLLTVGAGDGIGNAREPRLFDVWFPAPVLPARILNGKIDVPGNHPISAFSDSTTATANRDLLLHGVFAPLGYIRGNGGLDEPEFRPAPLFVIAPGLFDSVDQHYVRDTISVCHEMGGSVLALDMRWHGDTLRLDHALHQDPVTYSMGAFEGDDIAAVLQFLVDEGLADRFDGVYLIGYSGGGRAVLRCLEEIAYASPDDDSILVVPRQEAKTRPGESLLIRGVLGVCPLLNVGHAKKKIVPVFREFFGRLARERKSLDLGEDALDEAFQRAIGFYEEDPGGPEVARAVADAADMAPLFFHAHAGRALATDFQRKRRLLALAHATIVYAQDDPVVQASQFEAFKKGLVEDLAVSEDKVATRVVGARRGGHCGFVVANQSLTRQWFWSWINECQTGWFENAHKRTGIADAYPGMPEA